MDYETFFQSLFGLLKSGENAYFVLYACATCVLTQIFKKLFVSKVKVDVLHKFDFAAVAPFIFGLAFAFIDVYAVCGVRRFGLDVGARIAVSAAAVGATSTVIFKLYSSLSGKSLKSLFKDDLFGIFYTQLMYFGNAREQLVSKQLNFKDFVEQVKLISRHAADIYSSDTDENVKRVKLSELLNGIVDDKSIGACVNVLNQALMRYTLKVGKTKENKTAEKTE